MAVARRACSAAWDGLILTRRHPPASISSRTTHICHETIYQALYHGGRGGLSRQLTRRLRTGRPLRRRRTGRPLRRRRRQADARQCRFIAPAVLIDRRPAIVEDRVRISDWEGDLIVGRMSQSAIGTLVDPTSRYLRLVQLPGGHRAEQPVPHPGDGPFGVSAVPGGPGEPEHLFRQFPPGATRLGQVEDRGQDPAVISPVGAETHARLWPGLCLPT
jgi:hypothetical protein